MKFSKMLTFLNLNSKDLQVLKLIYKYQYAIKCMISNINFLHQIVLFLGGSFGANEVLFDYKSITASNSSDFYITQKSVRFEEKDRFAEILVTLVDDTIPEDKETFEVTLTSINGKSLLGNITTVTVTIETNDNPYGLFGIYNTSKEIRIQNPVVNHRLKFPLTRLAGKVSPVTVCRF